MKHALRTLAEILVRVFLVAYGLKSALTHRRTHLPLAPATVHKILIIRLDLLGDVVFSAPAIRRVIAAFPGAAVDVLVLPYTAGIAAAMPGVRNVIALDINAYRGVGGLRRLPALFRTLRRLRGEQYDLCLSLSRWMGGLFAVLSGARLRAGPARETYWGCYNLPLAGARYRPGQHEVDLCLDLVAQVTGTDSEPDQAPVLGGDAIGAATSRTSGLAKPYVVAIPGSGNGSAKRWPGAYWRELTDMLVARDLNVVFCGSAAERSLVGFLAVADPLRVTDLMGKTTLDELARVLADAATVVAGDTGPLHLAAALGRPVVGIYGPTDPANTGPRGPGHQMLRSGIECSPCYDLKGPAECKLPDRSVVCMWSVKPEQVRDAVLTALGLGSG